MQRWEEMAQRARRALLPTRAGSTCHGTWAHFAGVMTNPSDWTSRPARATCPVRAPRGEITLTVTFGPAATPVLPRAVAYAMKHADDLSQEGPSHVAGDLSPGERPGALRQGHGPGGDGLRVAGHPPGGRGLSGASA